ncbi:B-cell differentiation antigen CD72 [Thamnophis elegans]|uniref:B-cell differentiation antigen CD72 n=1 Tax=Thamnophis elegans TaxID=35005 RepID=UPI001378D0B8|nr:B-cell differentiation antigen CD72 [Thamnophis elegans]
MFERVTYADLQFAGSPLEKIRGEGRSQPDGFSQCSPPCLPPLTPACLPEPDEEQLTYENLQGSGAQEEPPRTGQGAEGQSLPRETLLRVEGPAVAQGIQPRKQQPAARTQSALIPGHQGSTGWSPRTRWAALGVLAIVLFLLSIIISLGVQYAQASQQLQQASRDHAAELNSTLVALWRSWADGNRTQQQLQHQELLVDQTNRSLALLWRERASLTANLSRASSCQEIGCCPPGWKLFRWKCLKISDGPKPWEYSRKYCEGSSSTLLILKKPWEAHEVWPSESPERSTPYWIGLQKSWSSFFWVDQTVALGISVRGSRYKQGCVELHEGALNLCSCTEGKKFICEQPASPRP